MHDWMKEIAAGATDPFSIYNRAWRACRAMGGNPHTDLGLNKLEYELARDSIGTVSVVAVKVARTKRFTGTLIGTTLGWATYDAATKLHRTGLVIDAYETSPDDKRPHIILTEYGEGKFRSCVHVLHEVVGFVLPKDA